MSERLPNYEMIARLESELAREREVAASFDALSDRQKLATYLHEKTCTLPHADQCGWYYESWDQPQQGGTRGRYLSRADRMLAEGFSLTEAQRVIDIVTGR
jgi:hypothetical protein